MELDVIEKQLRSPAELMALVEALIFVADEPITAKLLAEVLDEERESIEAAIEEVVREYAERGQRARPARRMLNGELTDGEWLIWSS